MLRYDEIKKYKNLAKMIENSKAFAALIQELNTTYERVTVLNEKEASNAAVSETELSENKSLKVRKKELKTLITKEINSFKESNDNWIQSHWDKTEQDIVNEIEAASTVDESTTETGLEVTPEGIIPPSETIEVKETVTA